MSERRRIEDHRDFMQKEQGKRKEKEELITFLNKQQTAVFGEVIYPVKEEELQ